ncbi:MAG: 30S ribosomal protein S13 [Rickettsiales bacterium]|nr:30S ribosomal protein S13 [Rickettsiales bacterium]
MARVAGVNIPTNKRFVIALTYIYGIGRSRAEDICDSLKIDKRLRTSEVKEEVLTKVRDLINKQAADDDGSRVGLVEGDLRRRVHFDIKRLIELGCYRGIRHVKKLPVRGQRTHNNAKTKRGGKRVPIAAKKK